MSGTAASARSCAVLAASNPRPSVSGCWVASGRRWGHGSPKGPAGDVARPSAARPSEAPLDSSRHNLPASLTTFVGRERETLKAKRLLSMTRLLTLTGAGGCGKTRLALTRCEAVQLFRDRARARLPAFELTESNARDSTGYRSP